MLNRFLLAAVCLLMLASCFGTDNNEELIDIFKGKPKKEEDWGKLDRSIPNNIGITFTGDPETTRTITWQSAAASGEVIIGNDRFIAASDKHGDNYYHQVNLTGLVPGQTYRFIAGASSGYSPIYSFKTENASSPNDFYVLHITDPQIGTSSLTRTDAETWKRLIESAVKKCPDAAFVVNTGDIVNNINEGRIQFYFDYAQEILAKYAFVYSLGNNDSIDWYDRYFYTAENRNVDGSGVLYSFDYGSAHFVSINVAYDNDNDDAELNLELSDEQLDWLENDLMNTSKKWKVAMMHKPDFGREKSADAESDITRLFDKYNVNLVMAGHYHFYGRSKPIDAAGTDKEKGTVWTIINAAGKKFNKVSGEKYLARDEQPELPMFCELRFTETNLYLRAYTVDSDGEAILFDMPPAYYN